MNPRFTEQLDPVGYSPTEYDLNFALSDISNGELSSFRGNLIGPYCQYARTLPVTFSVPECKCTSEVSRNTQRIVTDPCYWTPQLPYLYNFEGDLTLSDQSVEPFKHTVGFKRWDINKQNFLIERRRVVLRGMATADESTIDLASAHDAETAVLVNNPSEPFLQQASESGVLVIADLRNYNAPLTPKLISLAWQPSVALVLISEKNSSSFYLPPSTTLCQTIHANASPTPEVLEDWAKVILVEMNPSDSLPPWLASIEKPVIVVRSGENHTDAASARQACDQLQANLAPEFNLAGYFVAP